MDIFGMLEKIREQKPLIHHITNWVTIYDCANVVKVLGASPVMAHAREEVQDMVKIASALVLNIGTLTPEIVKSMKSAAKDANECGIPVVLDACGAGATPFRNKMVFELLSSAHIDIIKGNASEIAKVSGENVTTKGVDAGKVDGNLMKLAQRLAIEIKSTVVITGKEDIITNGTSSYYVKNGHELMGSVVGTGCMAASVIGAFAAVEKKYSDASAAALAVFGIAGEIAASKSSGPGLFKEYLFDALYHMDNRTITDKAMVS